MGCQPSKPTVYVFDRLDDSIHLLTKQAMKEARISGSPIRSYRQAPPHPLLANDCSVRTASQGSSQLSVEDCLQRDKETD